MATEQKYRVNDFAKDFGIPSKEIMTMLAEHEMVPKTHMAALDGAVSNFILEYYTQKYMADQATFAAYMTATAPEKQGNVSESKEETKPAPAAAKPAPAAAKPAPAPAKPAPAAAKPAPAPAKPAPAAAKPAPAPAKPAPAAAKPAPAPAKPAPAAAKPAPAPAKPAPAAAKPAPAPAKPAPAAAKPAPAPAKPITPPKKAKGEAPRTTRADTVRVIDTKAAEVNLARYDEKLDSFVSDHASRANDMQQSVQRIKRSNDNRRGGGKQGFSKSKKDSEADKLRRIQLEKLKNRKEKIQLPGEIVVSDLALLLKKTANEVVKKLMVNGFMNTVSDTIDYDTAALIAEEFNFIPERKVEVTIEQKLFDEREDEDEALIPRSPVVVVMGHVDHGKTSLLDYIRKAHVTAGEAGGITQHIGAYRVRVDDRDITFLDTPGHAAFTAMRARGASVTDIAIIVVAADDGIMPQTIEAINHAKAAGVSIVVAINKMDKPTADKDRVLRELSEQDLLVEEWGGDIVCVPVSALTGMNVDKLLEMVVLVADMKELKANPNRAAKGTIVEARLDKGRGPVATVLVQNGTLHPGDTIIAGTSVGRVRAMTDEHGRQLKEAGPSVPVEIIGLAEVPNAGDIFHAVEDERMARELVDQRRRQEKDEQFRAAQKVSLEDLFARIQEGAKSLNVIIKADVQGSCEAVRSSLEKLSTEEVKVNVIHSGVGAVKETDIMLADASNALVVGFNVRPETAAKNMASEKGIDIRCYRIIYECIEEIQAAMKGMLDPTYREVIIGHAEVRQTFRVPGAGTIAGCHVTDGKIARNALLRLLRDNVVIAEDKISSLKRFKDDAKEVAEGYDCGIGLEKFNDIREGDMYEAFIMEEIKD